MNKKDKKDNKNQDDINNKSIDEKNEISKDESKDIDGNNTNDEKNTMDRKNFVKESGKGLLKGLLIGSIISLEAIMPSNDLSASTCSDCYGTCQGYCNDCAASCGSGCSSNCIGGCTGGCSACTGCTGSCSSCTYSCQGCSGCSGSCTSSCTGTCSGCNGCVGTCSGTCSTGCTSCTGCSGTCSGCGDSCSNNCSGCTGTCSSTCTSCSGTCTGSCTSCSGTCTGSCTGTCTGTCTSTCTGTCSGTCTSTCTGTCTNGCTGSCTGSCTDSCTGSCSSGCTSCSNTCTGSCNTTCTGTCSGTCNSTCVGTSSSGNGTKPSGDPGKEGDPHGKDPVNMRTGNYVLTTEDFTIPGIGLDLAFIRTYNSKVGYLGPFGWGWTHNYNHKLFISDEFIEYFNASGNMFKFVKSGNTYLNPKGFKGKMTFSNNEYVINMVGQYKYHFNITGQFIRIDDNNGNSINITYDGEKILYIEDTIGRKTVFGYNANSRISRITLSDGTTYDYEFINNANQDLLLNITNSNGYKAYYEYDGAYNMIKKSDPKSPVGFANVSFVYDNQNRVIEMKDIDNISLGMVTYQSGKTIDIDAKGNSVIYEFDNYGNTVKVTDKLGRIIQYAYDDQGNVLRFVNNDGKQISFTYDTENNLTSVTDQMNNTVFYGYNNGFYKVSQIASSIYGIVMTYDHDGFGNLIRMTDNQRNRVTNIAIYPNGLISSIMDFENKTTNFSYDTNGMLAEITTYDNKKYQFVSDQMGRLMQMTDYKGNTTSITYEYGRIKRIDYPFGHYEEIVYTDNGYMKTVVNDGKTSTNYYNTKDRLIKINLPDNSNIGFEYDINGNMVKINDRGGKSVGLAYCNDDKVSGVDHYGASSNAFEYDSIGRLSKVTEKNGTVHTYSYDALDRLTGFDDSSFIYNARQRLSSVYNTQSAYNFQYDVYDRLTHAIEQNGNDTAFGYNDDDTLAKYAAFGIGGFEVEFDRNEKKLITGVKVDGNYSAQLEYDGDDKVVKTTLGNGLQEEYGYDNNFDLLITSKISGLNDYTVEYDKDLRVVSETIDGSKKVYSYNSTGEIVNVSKTNSVYMFETYGYNLDGNRTKKATDNSSYISYSYNDKNQLISQSLINKLNIFNTNKTSYAYDANGNLKTKIITTNSFLFLKKTETYDYFYDKYNRLINVKKNGVDIQTNVYDALGYRIKKITQTGEINYLFGGMVETDGNGNVIAQYQANRVIIKGKTYYPVRDVRGSVIKLLDENKNAVKTYSLDTYGKTGSDLINIPDAIGFRYLFCGCEYDAETGLYKMGTRYYDPDIGRFITPDPIGYVGGLNIYAYCHNDPVNFIDPTGLDGFHLGLNPGWSHDAPQRWFGYFDWYDVAACFPPLCFDINSAKFKMANGITLRLWKGTYRAWGGAGGEIGFYRKDGYSLTRPELKKIGLVSTSLEIIRKLDGISLGKYTEKSPSFWTTVFKEYQDTCKENLYTINTFNFEDESVAQCFFNQITSNNTLNGASKYFRNLGSSIDIRIDGKSIIIIWGKDNPLDINHVLMCELSKQI
jgi:RHS repeat-associated protein